MKRAEMILILRKAQKALLGCLHFPEQKSLVRELGQVISALDPVNDFTGIGKEESCNRRP